jgi:hypothetical protein
VTESISPTAAITIQIKRRKLVIRFSPSGANGTKKFNPPMSVVPSKPVPPAYPALTQEMGHLAQFT